MAEHEHVLNDQQFMSVKDMGNLQSQDFPGKTMHQAYGILQKRKFTSDSAAIKQVKLQNDIKANGMNNPIDVHTGYNPPMVGDGHHRYAAARSNRMKQVPVNYREGE